MSHADRCECSKCETEGYRVMWGLCNAGRQNAVLLCELQWSYVRERDKQRMETVKK